jgi:folate-dependent phosphoribosylglycinamide formyltransferase PurN
MSIALITNAGGRQLDTLLGEQKFRQLVDLVITDSDNANCNIADKWNIDCGVVKGATNDAFNHKLADYLQQIKIKYLLSFGFTRIFTPTSLRHCGGNLFNSHFSLLPAFPGKKGADWTTNELPPKAIFERALLYGCRFIGNTIHQIDESVDGGCPVMQSCMVVPYDKDVCALRHELFVQECKCIFQFCSWLKQERVVGVQNRLRIHGASFHSAQYSPSLEESWIIKFNCSNKSLPSAK